MKLIALLLSALVLSSCGALETATRLANLNEVLVPQTRSLRLVNTNGNITITGLTARNNINIDADFFAHADSIEEAQQLVDAIDITWDYTPGGVVVVVVTGVAENCGAHLSVQIPEDFNIDIRNENGNVDVVPVVRAVSLRTVNGNLVVNSHSKVRAKSTNGHIIYQGNSRDFDLRTSNGNINVSLSEPFDGSGSLATTNGSLRIKSSSIIDAKVAGDTVNGDYMIYGPSLFPDQGTGLIRLATVNGDINITHVKAPDTVE
jgi:hypothetical protein